MDPIVGTFLKLPSNEPVNVLARVYVIKVRHLMGTATQSLVSVAHMRPGFVSCIVSS